MSFFQHSSKLVNIFQSLFNWGGFSFDDLLQIQSLNENQMVIIPAAIMEGNGTKQILVGTNQKKTEEYKSWQELVNNINRNIGLKTENSVNKIFESKLSNEINQNIEKVNKINQESPTVMDLILGHKIDLVIDTPTQGRDKSRDGFLIRRTAIETGVNCLTSLDTANALVTSLENAGDVELNLVNIAEI